MEARTNRSSLPLAVDLDGTVIVTDLFWEALVRLFKSNPFLLFLAPFWLLRGKAFIKQELEIGRASCRERV